MWYPPVLRQYRSRIVSAFALASRRVSSWGAAGAMLMLLSVSGLWPVRAMAQPVLSIDDVSVSEGDSVFNSFFFDVRLDSPAPPGGIAFEFSTSDGTADSSDYDGHSFDRGRIEEGSRQTRIEISVFGDYDIEPDEIFFVNLLNATGATIGDPQAVGTILDDDSIPRRISIDDAVAAEGDALHFAIMLDKAARPGGVSFDVTTSDNSAIGGVDYQVLPTTRITIPQGARQADIFVTSLADNLAEGEESLHLDIDHVTGAEPDAARAVGTISDATASRPTIDIENTQIVEGDSGVTPMAYRVTLSEPVAQTVSVDYRSFPEGDIGETTGRVIFHPGETVKFATVPVAGDMRVESDVAINVELFDAVNADVGNSQATGIVYDDDTDLALSPTALPDGRFGERYDQMLIASGGHAPYTMSITAGTLPPGMQLVLSNGRYYVVDTPTSVGTYDFTVTVTDSSAGPAGPYSVSRNYMITVNAPPTIVLVSTPESLSGSQFQPFSARIDAAGGAAPYLFAVIGGRLPNGVALNADGTLSGTPTESGTFPFTVSATDHVPGIPQTASRDFFIYIAPAPLSLTPSTLPSGYLNETYSHPLTALGGQPPYAFGLTAGALPPGVQLLSYGAIYGIPTAPGQYRFSVTANDNAQPTRSQATVEYIVDIVERPLQLDPKTLVPITGGAAFQTFFSARGGTAPYAFSISAGALPSGLSLASNGALQGVPAAIGSFDFDVQAADSVGATATQTFRLEVVLPVVTIDSALSDGQAGNQYAQSVHASGGLEPYTFSVTAGALPPGLQLDPRGIVAGVPTTAGSYTFTLTVADSNVSIGPVTASRTYTIRIEPAGLLLAPATLPNASTQVNYFQILNASGGISPYEYHVSAGALPPGMYIFYNFLAGVPSVAGTYDFSITATDRTSPVPLTGTRDYTLVVELSAIAIDPLVFPEAMAGRAYGQAVRARGGVPPYRYSLASGVLPPGMNLSADGDVSGTPTAAGEFNFTVMVADSANGTASTATRDFSLKVALPMVNIYTERLQPAAVGSNYLTTITTYGGQAPYTYALTAGILPTGLQLTADGFLRGVPEATGSFEITITATDSSAIFGPLSGSRSYTLVVEPRILSFQPGFLPQATQGVPYFARVEGLNGVAPYHFSVTNGALPPGLSLADDGTISGIPGAPQGSGFYQYNFALSIVDANGVSATFPYVEILLQRPVLRISPATLPAATAGIGYRQQFTALGAIGAYAITWESGTLPNGLQFDPATATLSGIALETGQFPFQLRLVDAENRYVVYNYVLDIASPTLTLTPETLPDGVAGTAYAQTFTADGGLAPYRYFAVERIGDSLPPGLSLGEDGILQGTPTTAGAFTFGVVAMDSTGGEHASVQRTYTMTISTPSITVDPVALPKAVGGLDYAQTFTARGGTAPYTFSISAGALPPGLTLSVAGVLSGTPTGAGDSSFTVTATDASGFSGARLFTLALTVPIPVPAARIFAVAAGATLTLDMTEGASGGPFIAATLVSLSPSNAGTARIVGADGRYRLEFMPGHAFSGRAIVTFTLSNAFSTSAPTTIVFDVAPRPDPSRDPEAGRLLDAQVQAAQRFAGAQIDNFQQRLERMHGAGAGMGFSNGLSATVDAYCPQSPGMVPGRRCARNASEAGIDDVPQTRGKGSETLFGIWTSGTIRSGNHDGRNSDPNIDFETDGVSVGLDYRVNEALAFGAGLGYGRDESDIGDSQSRSESDAFTLALYASYSPHGRWFVDTLLGYQSLGFDLHRFVTSNGNFVDGKRKGSQWFGSVSAGADFQKGAWQFTPYVRGDVARAQLDGYTEHGDPIFALRYEGLGVDTDTGNAGIRIDYRHDMSWGLLSPQFRVEYQHDFKGNGAQTMRYADLASGPFYRAGLTDFDRTRLMLGLGVLFDLNNDWSFKFDYRGLIGSGNDTDHGFQINVDRKF